MTTNSYWRLDRRPVGNDYDSALTLVTEPLPDLAGDEGRIRNAYLSMDAGTRMWMTDREDGYNPPVPLGSPMPGMVLGWVEASANEDYKPGDLVRGFGQWGAYSQVEPASAALERLDANVDDIRDYFGAIGVNAWTALWGLTETARVEAGDTVVVSAAAGATGVLACQIANILGCRTIAIAGGAQKCAWLREHVRVAQTIDYKNEDVAAALARVDGGIDAYFDNVGGPILDAVLANMALHGRIAVCGLLDQYRGDGRSPGPAHYDQILMKRLRVEGFFIPDFFAEGARLTNQLRTWVDAGQLFTPFDVTTGLDNTLSAYRKLFEGGNIGKVLVALGDS